MVIAKPIQFTMVMEDARYSGLVFCEIRAENCGESPATLIPQINMMVMKTKGLTCEKETEKRQHINENDKQPKANFALPNLAENSPVNTQAISPEAIIKNDHNEILKE